MYLQRRESADETEGYWYNHHDLQVMISLVVSQTGLARRIVSAQVMANFVPVSLKDYEGIQDGTIDEAREREISKLYYGDVPPVDITRSGDVEKNPGPPRPKTYANLERKRSLSPTWDDEKRNAYAFLTSHPEIMTIFNKIQNEVAGKDLRVEHTKLRGELTEAHEKLAALSESEKFLKEECKKKESAHTEMVIKYETVSRLLQQGHEFLSAGPATIQRI